MKDWSKNIIELPAGEESRDVPEGEWWKVTGSICTTYGVYLYDLRGLFVQFTGSICTKWLREFLRIRPKREERSKIKYKFGGFTDKFRSRNTRKNV
jgi:hypothetical protein